MCYLGSNRLDPDPVLLRSLACSQKHKEAFADDRVQFVQADLTRDAHVDRAFNPEFGPYDFVFNLAGETKCGLTESVYASKVCDLARHRTGGLCEANAMQCCYGCSAAICPSNAVRKHSART